MRKESRMWGKPRRGGVPDIEGSAYPELRAMRSLGVINVVRLRRRGRCTVRGTRCFAIVEVLGYKFALKGHIISTQGNAQ